MSKRSWAIVTLIIAAFMGLASINVHIAMERDRVEAEAKPKRFCVPLYDQTGLECVKCE